MIIKCKKMSPMIRHCAPKIGKKLSAFIKSALLNCMNLVFHKMLWRNYGGRLLLSLILGAMRAPKPIAACTIFQKIGEQPLIYNLWYLAILAQLRQQVLLSHATHRQVKKLFMANF